MNDCDRLSQVCTTGILACYVELAEGRQKLIVYLGCPLKSFLHMASELVHNLAVRNMMHDLPARPV